MSRHCSGLLRTVMTSTPWTSSSGSPCSRISMRSSTTTTWTARSVSSAKSWGSPNTTEPLPRSSSPDSSKLKRQQDDLALFCEMTCKISYLAIVLHFHFRWINFVFKFTFQIRQVSWGLEPARRHEGAFGRVLGRQLQGWAEQGLRRVLPVPLLHQGLHEEEQRRKQPVKNSTNFLHK